MTDTIELRRQCAVGFAHVVRMSTGRDSMFIFIDESGDPGFDIERGASELFVVAAVMFNEERDASACSARVDQIRRECGLPPHVELRFVKSSHKVRQRFLDQVSGCNFFYLAVVIDKRKLTSRQFPSSSSFYEYIVGLTLEFLRPHLQGASVDVDRSGSADFGKKLCSHISKNLRGKDGKPLLRRIRTIPSHSSNLMQLADMVCGAVARSVRGRKKQDGSYRKIIIHRELGLHERP